MTISSSTNRSGPYNGNGVTVVFARTFLILGEDHLAVYETVDGVTTKVTTGFTIGGVGEVAGDVTYAVAPPSGTQVTLIRDIPLTQDTDYSAQGKVSPDQVESDFDLQEMKVQDLSERVDRSYRAPVTGKAFTPDNVPKFDADGNLVDGPTATEVSNAQAHAEAAEISADRGEAYYFALIEQRFDILSYIAIQDGGPEQVDYIRARNYNAVDWDITTAGAHAAIAAAFNSNAPFVVEVSGFIPMNRPPLSAILSSGQTAAEYIQAGSLSKTNPNIKQYMAFVGTGYGSCGFIVDNTFEDNDTSYPGSWMFYINPPSPRLTGPQFNNIWFYEMSGDHADFGLCPGGIFSSLANYADIRNVAFQGESGNGWRGHGVIANVLNNSNIDHIHGKCGFQRGWHDFYGQRFDVTSTTQIESADASAPFAIPAGEASTYWDDRVIYLPDEVSPNSETTYVKTAATGARIDDNTLALSETRPAQATGSGVAICSEVARASMTAGSNEVTFTSPVAHPTRDQGRYVVLEDGRSTTAVKQNTISGYMDNISADGKTFDLVQSDGTPVNANANITEHFLHMGGGFWMIQRDEDYGDSLNNAGLVSNIMMAVGLGLQFLLQRVNALPFQALQSHGIAANTRTTFREDLFAWSGRNMVIDNCPNLCIDKVLFRHSYAGDSGAIYVTGDSNDVTFLNWDNFNHPNIGFQFELDGTNSQQRLTFGKGLIGRADFVNPANDLSLFKLNGYSPRNINILSGATCPVPGKMDSNGLDVDLYDEVRSESWVPTIEFGGAEISTLGGTYATQVGVVEYISPNRIGIEIEIDLTALGTATGQFSVPLPDWVVPASNDQPLSVTFYQGLSGLDSHIWASVQSNGTVILRDLAGGANQFTNASDIRFTDTSHIKLRGEIRIKGASL